MQYYRYSRGIQIDHETLTIKEALELIRTQETALSNKENYLGFTYENNDATIQFVRKTMTEWIIDIPFYEKGEFTKAVDAEIPHSLVIDIVTRFFDPKDPLTKSLMDPNYSLFEQILLKDYGVKLSEVDLKKELDDMLRSDMP